MLRAEEPEGGDQEIELKFANDIACPRCGQDILCALDVPHSFRRADGKEVHGTRAVPLCRDCDSDSEAGRGLIAFFTVHDAVGPESIDEFATLVREWASQVTVPIVSDEDVEEDIRQWEAGEL